MFNLYDDSVANFNAWRGRQVASTAGNRRRFAVFTLIAAWLVLLLASAAAWITHVIVCIKASAWILLAFGCVVAPVGVVHGFGVWLGVFE